MAKKVIEDEEHFRLFAKTVEHAIAKYGKVPDEELVTLQCKQVDNLSALEEQFRKALVKDRNGVKAYEFFLDYILKTKKNILAARPYFRERRSFFASDISSAIRDRNVKKLQKFHINFHFISLVRHLKFSKKVANTINEIVAARQELATMNMPLVINRARIFWSRTPKSHLSFMDLVQIGTEGLMSAIDKFCGEYSTVWAGVVIGRIVGYLINWYSSTVLHFYPSDKRKIYGANKFMSRHLYGDYGIEDLVKSVNSSAGSSTDEDEIQNLIAAAAVVSADTPPVGGNDISVQDSISRYAAPEENRPDEQVEHEEAKVAMRKAIDKLSIFDKKLLRLKGVESC